MSVQFTANVLGIFELLTFSLNFMILVPLQVRVEREISSNNDFAKTLITTTTTAFNLVETTPYLKKGHWIHVNKHM